MRILKPITALRFLTLLSTILFTVALFLPKDSSGVGFISGMGVGLGIGVQVMVWNRSLEWRDQDNAGETIRMDLAQRER